MSILDEKLNLKEKKKLENMFAGDKCRDASEKIRGFLFQDLVALYYLLNENTEYVCLEFLEDVNVFCDDGTLKIIQVKYIPKSDLNMKVIMTDLYYQFLRAEILKLEFKPKMRLVIHGKDVIDVPDQERMETYIDYSKQIKEESEEDEAEWLSKVVYVSNKKADQKKMLFDQKATDKSISCFLKNFKFVITKDIVNYQEEIADKLSKEFPDSDVIKNKTHRKKILMGLAVGYLQKRYTLNDPDIDELKVKKTEFVDYIRQTMETETEKHIVGYSISLVGEQYSLIIKNNLGMNKKDIELLNYIAHNTQIWISELVSTKEGQYKLVNTFSYDNEEKKEDFMESGVSDRRLKIAECSGNIQIFLRFLWKIMLDLCRSKQDFELKKDEDMLKPQSYINSAIESYVCLKFKGDFVDTSVILPPVRKATKEEDLANICSRMYLEKPQKWYMSGDEYGKKEYSYSTANIKEGDSVADTEDDSYFIECMDCIKIDKNQWCNVENCEQCIFAKTCVKGKEY